MKKDRRKFLGFLSTAGAATALTFIPRNALKEIEVEKETDWNAIPTFNPGIARLSDMRALTECVLQLQNEVQRLKAKA